MQYYKSSNSNFNKNGDVKLQPINGTVRVELNTGLNEIDFEIPYDKTRKWKKINCWGVVKQKVFYSKNKQLYRIYSVTKGMFSIKIKARHIFFDLVKRNILDARAVNLNGERALNTILEGTGFRGHSDINIVNTAYFVQTNTVAAINGDKDNTFRNRWGGEMLYDNFDIYINKRIGADYGVKVRYGINMENVDLDINRDEIITRAYPIAFDGKMLPEKYIDSPLINKYPFVCEGYVDMSDLKLKDSNSEDDEGFETEEELFNAMRERMLQLYNGGLDKPKVSGSVKMVNLENTLEYKDFKNLVNVGIGDTVTVNHKNIDVDMKTRAIAIEWDIITEKYTDVEFGDVELNYFDSQEIINGKLENILNNNGTVNSSKMEGVINAVQTKFKALRDVAQPQHIVAMLFEDKIKGSATYGAMAIGSMGFMIASERTLDDKDWNWRTFGSGQGFFADWLVGKLKTVLIQNMDASFELDLNKPGGAIFRNNGKKAMEIANNKIGLFNYLKEDDYIGGLLSLINKEDPDKPLVCLANDYNSSMSLGYEVAGSRRVPSYGEFDKYGILGNDYPITWWEETEFKKAAHFLSVLFGEHKIYDSADNNLVFKVKSGKNANIVFDDLKSKYFFSETGFTLLNLFKNEGSSDVWCLDNLKVDRNFHVNGGLTCSGSKNRVVDTEHYGKIKMNAFETAECYFSDVGRAKLKNGKCIIRMDKKFLETVNTNVQYEVQTWVYGNGIVWVEPSEMYPQYVIVRGANDIEFGYNIMAKQKDYETARMEEYIKEKNPVIRTRNTKSNLAIKPKERSDN